jgi:hypothetical protein
MRQVIGLALVLLFGPAQVMSLLAESAEPQCQMACCKRARAGQSCPLHHVADADSAQGFHAANDCPAGCSQVSGAPSAFAAGFLQAGAWFFLPRIEKAILRERTSSAGLVLSPFLYQRPPPGLSA